MSDRSVAFTVSVLFAFNCGLTASFAAWASGTKGGRVLATGAAGAGSALMLALAALTFLLG